MAELEIRAITASLRDPLWDALNGAEKEGAVTWLTDCGKRIAAIVPAQLAEHALTVDLASPSARVKFLGRWLKEHDDVPKLDEER